MGARIKNREDWLMTVARKMQPIIEEKAGIEIHPFRVTCGFPSSGGMIGGRSRTRGECWHNMASADDHAEIFISPVEDDIQTVTAILAHEMIHAAMPEAGHKKPFQRAASAIGHVKPFTTATDEGEFWAWAGPIAEKVGPYPHQMLNAQRPVAAKKKQSTRMIKCECATCGYVVRTSRKWIEDVGAPHCPNHGPMTFELPDDEGDEE